MTDQAHYEVIVVGGGLVGVMMAIFSRLKNLPGSPVQWRH